MVKSIIKLVLLLVFLAAGLLFYFEKKDEFHALDWPSTPAIVAVCLAYVTNIYINALFNAISARRLGVHLSYTESFMLSSVTAAANFLLPLRAGAAFRAMYMKKAYGFQYSYFASTLAFYYLATILVASFTGMICLLFIYLDQGYFRLDIFLLLPAAFIVASFILLLRKGGEISHTPEQQSWRLNFMEGYRHIISDNWFIYNTLSLIVIGFIVSTLGWTVALRDYAPLIGWGESFLIVTSQIIGGLITLTPGGAGFQELAGLYVGHRFQITMVELFAVLVWTKAVRIIVSVLLALPSLVFLKRNINSS
jgi:uncharacterized membrane protein YbhN (UPF0104 family)